MAHVGKRWKLQFRRDLWSVGFNADHWAEAYRYQQTPAFGVVAADFLSSTVPLVNLLTNDQPPMVWRSGPRVAAGITYDVIYSQTEPNFPDLRVVTFTVKDLTHGVDLFRFNTIAGLLGGGPAQTSVTSQAVSLESPLWNTGGQSFIWRVDAMTWAEYNP